eukprot:2296794-Amphidinium_carterae.1
MQPVCRLPAPHQLEHQGTRPRLRGHSNRACESLSKKHSKRFLRLRDEAKSMQTTVGSSKVYIRELLVNS